MKRFINFFFVAGACVGAFYLIGLIAPRAEITKVKGRVDVYPLEAAKVVSDFESWPTWHPTIQGVRERDSKAGHAVWTVTDRDLGSFDIEILSKKADSGWSGSWNIDGQRFQMRMEFRGYGADATLIFVQLQQDIADPWLRAKRLFTGGDISVEEIVTSLGKKLGSPVTLVK